MQLIHIIILLITGICVGFASGLLGVGGCFIMIPVQFWVLTSIGINPKIAILVAFGTNLLVVLSTAISGALGHSRKNAVLWREAITSKAPQHPFVLGETSLNKRLNSSTLAEPHPNRKATSLNPNALSETRFSGFKNLGAKDKLIE